MPVADAQQRVDVAPEAVDVAARAHPAAPAPPPRPHVRRERVREPSAPPPGRPRDDLGPGPRVRLRARAGGARGGGAASSARQALVSGPSWGQAALRAARGDPGFTLRHGPLGLLLRAGAAAAL